ncbi:3-hydroxyisobutyryl-CoA hydrolase [Vanrija albida]|uniref:3-hydroxyisobutyryl-CoA hydrolase n=1 Tax=Vanrija albida TaxID=181172 RepID=A0ABR3QA23_9TREE
MSRLLARMAPRLSAQSAASARLSAVKRHMSSSPVVRDDSVLYENQGTTRTYKLNRPKALNALDQPMIDSLVAESESWRTSDLVKLVVGKGDERAFCAGGDVKTLVIARSKGDAASGLKFFQDEFGLNWHLGRLGKPYVAVIDGFTMGGGAGISLPAPIRIATKKTVFAMPETKIGYAPDVGGNYYIAQLDGEIGAWLAITGNEVWGRAVYELGLATHYVDPESLPSLLEALNQIEEPSFETISNLVSSYHVGPAPAGTAVSSKASREGPSPITGEIRAFLDKTFGLPSLQDIYAALKAAEGDSSLAAEVREWATAQRGILDERSPTGMAVALENFRLARKAKRLNEVLDNDITMATGFLGLKRTTDDFSTGVTHLLIDKAKGRANWSPSSIDDKSLTPAAIRANFLDAKAAHIAGERPTIDFTPTPTTKEGPDSTWGQFRRYGLPAEARVRAWIKGEAPGSGAFKLNEDELVSRIVDVSGEAGSPRQKEIEDAIRKIVAQRTTKDKDGYLNWK